jgi:hypothetical protein
MYFSVKIVGSKTRERRTSSDLELCDQFCVCNYHVSWEILALFQQIHNYRYLIGVRSVFHTVVLNSFFLEVRVRIISFVMSRSLLVECSAKNLCTN